MYIYIGYKMYTVPLLQLHFPPLFKLGLSLSQYSARLVCQDMWEE